MKIESFNLNKDLDEKYCFEYLYKGLLFFIIGNLFIWYKIGRMMFKFTVWFGKLSWKIIENIGKNYDKKDKKRK